MFLVLNQQVVPLKGTTCFSPRKTLFLLKKRKAPQKTVFLMGYCSHNLAFFLLPFKTYESRFVLIINFSIFLYLVSFTPFICQSFLF